MMYQALYRKYRPKTFDDVVGQEHITETLKKQVETGRLSHAYLFIGTRGTGKTTCAKILAKAVNCEHPVNGNPCNRCAACRGIDDGSVLDVVELDAASNNGVDNVRALRDEAVFSPASVRKRVYIVDEVHMLSNSAFNALLKILEEPPEHLMFILATTELHKVPATILSRCQRHSFKRIPVDTITARLNFVAQQEHLDLQPDAAALLARMADGGMRDALTLLDQCCGNECISTDAVISAIGLAGNLRTAQLLRSVAAGDTAGALEQFRELWQDGKDPSALLDELSMLQRDLLMQAVAPRGGRELLSGAYDPVTLDELSGAFSSAQLLANLQSILQTLGAILAEDRTAAVSVLAAGRSGSFGRGHGNYGCGSSQAEEELSILREVRMASVKIGKRSLRAAVVCLLLLGLFALILFGVSRFQHRQVVPEQMQIVPLWLQNQVNQLSSYCLR